MKIPFLLTLLALSTVSLFFTGCSTLHDVQENPQPSIVATNFPSIGEAAPRDPQMAWWSHFENPELDQVIETALQENLTVSSFASRVLAAQAVARQAGADLRPQLEASGNFGLGAGGSELGEAFDNTGRQLNAGLVAAWEIDLFGRLRSRRNAALQDVDAARVDLDAVRLSISALTATAYYQAVEQRQLLELLEAQVESDRVFLDLTELRFRQGVTDRVDLVRQQALLAETLSLVPPARSLQREAENRLDVLMGKVADARDRVTADFPPLKAMPIVGVPGDLLLHRPDLRALQLRLEGLDFSTAEAIADRLPRLQLTAGVTYSDGPSPSAAASSLLAGIFGPILDGGRRAAVVEERRAEYDVALAEFTETFLIAISEVENLLFRSVQQEERLLRLADRARLLGDALAQSRVRYANGLIYFLEVLTALEDLQETERDVISARREQVQLRIDLRRAIGGSMDPILNP